MQRPRGTSRTICRSVIMQTRGERLRDRAFHSKHLNKGDVGPEQKSGSKEGALSARSPSYSGLA
jgi:hypothetical protein